MTMTLPVVVTSVLVLAGTACSDRSAAPTSPTAPTPAPGGYLVGIAIAGNLTLRSIGQTSQLTLTATYSDRATRDVSSEGQWTAANSEIASLSATGLLTAVAFGRTSVSGNFGGKTVGAVVTATPEGTFVIFGRVREPGQGGVQGATVMEKATGRSVSSDRLGFFSIGALPAADTRLSLSNDDYEPREIDASATMEVDAPMQRIVRITAGESVQPVPLAPNDLAYDVDGLRCRPCRLIRIIVPTTGDMELRLTWRARVRLSLSAGGMSAAGDAGSASGFLTISTPGELVVYVGSTGPLTDHVDFRLETSLP
jgi:hypothetical protein